MYRMGIWKLKYLKFGPYDCYIYDESSKLVGEYHGVDVQKFGELQEILGFRGLKGRENLHLSEEQFQKVVAILGG